MIQQYKTKELKLNADILGRPAGSKIPVKIDTNGNPLNADVRRHLRDAKFDNCCELITAGKKKNKFNKGGKTK